VWPGINQARRSRAKTKVAIVYFTNAASPFSALGVVAQNDAAMGVLRNWIVIAYSVIYYEI